MTATRTLAKKAVKNFFEKSVREGKKVENAIPKNERREARFLRTQRRGPFRIGAGFPVARVLRLAARVLKKPTFAVPNPKNETRLRRRRGRNQVDRRAERDARRSAQTSALLSRKKRFCQRGETAVEALIENRRLGNAVFKIFEFRGEFVLLDFVVHRFFANAEFSRRESTTAVASDEGFEEGEPFDLRQRQPGESERRRRNVGATGRAKRNGKRTRRLERRRKGNVGDRNARFVGVCVARKSVNGTRLRDGKRGVDASRRRRGDFGKNGGRNVATERRFGGRGISAGKTVEGVHRRQAREGRGGKRRLTKGNADNVD